MADGRVLVAGDRADLRHGRDHRRDLRADRLRDMGCASPPRRGWCPTSCSRAWPECSRIASQRKTLLALSISARAALAALLGVALARDRASAPHRGARVLLHRVRHAVLPVSRRRDPHVVPEQELAPANAILTGLETLAFIAGPAAGAAALVLGSPATAMFVNALIFGVALAPIAKLRDRGERATTDDSLVDDAQDQGSPLTAGIRAITSSGEVAAPLLLVVAVNLVYGGSLVGLVLVADDLLGTGRSASRRSMLRSASVRSSACCSRAGSRGRSGHSRSSHARRFSPASPWLCSLSSTCHRSPRR